MAYNKLIPPVGTTSVLSARTGTANEVALDSTTKEFVVFDGSTVGGIRMAKKSDVADLADSVKDLTAAVNAILEYMEDNNVLVKPVTTTTTTTTE